MEPFLKIFRLKMNYMFRKNILFAFLFSLLSYSGLTQNQQEKVISLQEAIAIGLDRNVGLRQAENQLMSLSMDQTQAKMAYLPNVSLNVRATRQVGQQFQLVEDGFEISNVQADRLSGGLSASLSIFEGFNRQNQMRISDLEYKAQSEGIEREKQNVIFLVAQQYLQILLDQQLLEIARKNVENQNKQLDRIEGFTKTGLRPQADFFTQNASVKQLEMEYIEAENTLLLDKAQLTQILQLDPLEEYVISSDGLMDTPQDEKLELAELFNLAIENRADLKQLKFRTQSANQNIESMKSGYLPNLRAFYEYGTQYSSLNTLNYRDQLLDLYPTNIVGLNLNIPIFNNYINKANVERAKVNLHNTQLDFENTERIIFQDVQNAYLNYNAAIKRFEVSNAAFEAAEEAFKVQEERYNEGIANLADLSLANQEYVTASANKEQARFTLIFQEMILEYQVGTLEIE
ncbi:transporter [Marivirga tractuosa]|uniref:Outer membrane efflux protein n=2 Tax=Marivirga TaxID=869806 RepID=E4TMH2_MARTH|nr:outer membrane efflux protein [Marivirga tractuosa DSM 4126]BDD15919.1 transporter [Marivirga tractuosa]